MLFMVRFYKSECIGILDTHATHRGGNFLNEVLCGLKIKFKELRRDGEHGRLQPILDRFRVNPPLRMFFACND